MDILNDMLGDDDDTLSNFCRVMQQLMIKNNLSWNSECTNLVTFHLDDSIQGQEEEVLSKLGGLFTGIFDKSQLVKPIH